MWYVKKLKGHEYLCKNIMLLTCCMSSSLYYSFCFCSQGYILSVCPRRGAGQHVGDPAAALWGAVSLPNHQGGVQTSPKSRGRVSVCPLQEPDWGWGANNTLKLQLTLTHLDLSHKKRCLCKLLFLQSIK